MIDLMYALLVLSVPAIFGFVAGWSGGKAFALKRLQPNLHERFGVYVLSCVAKVIEQRKWVGSSTQISTEVDLEECGVKITVVSTGQDAL